MINIVFVVGARPNFMKVAPMLKEIQKNYAWSINPILVHTGQHYDFNMSNIFFEQLGVSKSPVCFGIGSGTHAYQTGEVMRKFEEFLETTAPKIDLVVVVGDVNSSMAAALVAAKANIPVAHVEAGLRSFDREMPEEINRIVIDSVSTLFFITEHSADENLRFEGQTEYVYRVGNVMIDTLVDKLPAARALDAYKTYGLDKGEYILLTMHRPSNVDDKEKLTSILKTVDEISQEHKVLFLAHPRTQKQMKGFGIVAENVIIEDPLGYLETLSLMENAKLVLTDSGGMQEETSFLGIPCITLRENTERPITIYGGTNTLVPNSDDLYEKVVSILSLSEPREVNLPLWDGKTSERIMKIIYGWIKHA